MSIQTLILLALNLSVFLTMLTIGVGSSGADLRSLASQPSRLIRSLVAINVMGPAIAIAVCKTFSLHPAIIVGLVTLSVAPVSNMFVQSMLPLVAPAHAAYAYGLFFASTVLSVILTPLAVDVIQAIFGGDQHVSPLAVAQVVIGSVLLPLIIGLAIGRRWPAIKRWIPGVQKVSMLVLLVCGVIIIAGLWSRMGSIVRDGTVTAIALITLFWLAAGHFLGGPNEDDRTILAHATVSRHPGVAIVVASLTDERLAPVGVLVAVLVSSLAMVPYTQWRKRRRGSAPPITAPPPPRAAH